MMRIPKKQPRRRQTIIGLVLVVVLGAAGVAATLSLGRSHPTASPTTPANPTHSGANPTQTRTEPSHPDHPESHDHQTGQPTGSSGAHHHPTPPLAQPPEVTATAGRVEYRAAWPFTDEQPSATCSTDLRQSSTGVHLSLTGRPHQGVCRYHLSDTRLTAGSTWQATTTYQDGHHQIVHRQVVMIQ